MHVGGDIGDRPTYLLAFNYFHSGLRSELHVSFVNCVTRLVLQILVSSSSASESYMDFLISKVWLEKEHIFIETTTGMRKSHPLSWFPKLLHASKEQREDFELSPMGIHWKHLDEDLSFEGFF